VDERLARGAEHPVLRRHRRERDVQLTDVPAGDYEVKVWHETLGERRRR
jgi:hypothetical protein